MGIYEETPDPDAIIEEESNISSTIEDVTDSALTETVTEDVFDDMSVQGDETILDSELEPDMPHYKKVRQKR